MGETKELSGGMQGVGPQLPARLGIPGRFCGPPGTGNGGYVAGRLAAFIAGPVAVRLKAPPPLDVDLEVEPAENAIRLRHGATLVAEARPAEVGLAAPSPPSYDEVVRASRSCPGFSDHPFPRCFVCGPDRAAGDGLRIFPGLTDDGSRYAAPWLPDASLADGSRVRAEFIWSALDCPGGFAVLPESGDAANVLAEMCARIDGAVAAGQRYIAVGWMLGAEGRKRFAGSAVYTEDGRPVAVARATWIAVPRRVFVTR